MYCLQLWGIVFKETETTRVTQELFIINCSFLPCSVGTMGPWVLEVSVIYDCKHVLLLHSLSVYPIGAWGTIEWSIGNSHIAQQAAPFLTIFSCCQGTCLWCFCLFPLFISLLLMRKYLTLQCGYVRCGDKSINTLEDVCWDDYQHWQRYNYTKEHLYRHHSYLSTPYSLYKFSTLY